MDIDAKLHDIKHIIAYLVTDVESGIRGCTEV